MQKKRRTKGTVTITKSMVIHDVNFPPGTYPITINQVGLDRLGGPDWYPESIEIDDPQPPPGVVRNTLKVTPEELDQAVNDAGGRILR